MQFAGLHNDAIGWGKVGSDTFGTYVSECGDINDRTAGFVSHKQRLLKNCSISVLVGGVPLFETATSELFSRPSNISSSFLELKKNQYF